MIYLYFIFGIFIFLLGLSMGSFINALVYRIYEKKSLLDRSECTKCHHKLNFWDLIPIFSFIFLSGKCRYCKTKISWQYPLVEFVTGIIFLLLFIKFLLENDFLNCELSSLIDFSSNFIFSIILITIFIYDLKHYIIPDKVLFTGIIIGVLTITFKSFYNWSLEPVISHAFSMLIVFGFFLLLYLISKGKWIGAGDVKFGILLGLIIPWPQNLVMLFISFVLGAIIGLILLLLKKKKLKEKVPMGTFLVAGTFITIFLGDIILNWYLNLIL